MVDEQLSQYFKFNESDLAANRSGYLSDGQKRKLSRRTTKAIQEKQMAVAIAFPISIFLLVQMILSIINDFGPGQTVGTGVFLILFQAIFGGLLLWASIYIFKLSRIRQAYLFKKIEGPINIIKTHHQVDDQSFIRNELHVAGETFSVEPVLANMMMQGDIYAFYCSIGAVSGLREIQSLELVEKAK